ncbi:MAG: 3'-5' exonuclease [Syntrophothermus sp.]
MFEQINIEHILFLDIETVPMSADYASMPEIFKNLWAKKTENLLRYEKNPEEVKNPETLFERAGIYAEFGKIVCISTGIYRKNTLSIKSYYGEDEKEMLLDFSSMLVKARDKQIGYLCAHNGREFDFPYLIRRMLVNGVPVPAILDLSFKKPWDVPHLDTLDMWKFGDFKSYTSLETLAALFGIPTPKGDINGADVARVYYEEKDLPRIVTYCQKDVLTIVNLFLKFQSREIVNDEMINFL